MNLTSDRRLIESRVILFNYPSIAARIFFTDVADRVPQEAPCYLRLVDSMYFLNSRDEFYCSMSTKACENYGDPYCRAKAKGITTTSDIFRDVTPVTCII